MISGPSDATGRSRSAMPGLASAESTDGRQIPDTLSPQRRSSASPHGGHAVAPWLQQLLEDSVRKRASDIHFEPFESHVSVRIRVDGMMIPLVRKPISWMLAIASRIKVMAELDIAECRLPQDGRIVFPVDGHPVTLRVSTINTVSGESIVARVLDQRAAPRNLESLGMPADILDGFRECLRSPHGLIVITGPTGSGKTTTLYGALKELNTTELKVLSAEDPVEYELEGVMQTAIQPAADVTFASLLRAFLRQDPDVIMVGEMRDIETARIAVQAALTGHLVITTLHTQDSASVVARMTDLGIEPYLIAATLVGVVAQRLVRRKCKACSREGIGCEDCLHTGYKGRLGLFELFRIDPVIRDLIAAGASTAQLREAAHLGGMRSISDYGMKAVDAGLVGRAEVLSLSVD
ncbi:MAG: type II/IV secretion system protein [Opitutaceae bacterium]|nr:type II/IV secretion system protein [Opitutaceae bacterium]